MAADGNACQKCKKITKKNQYKNQYFWKKINILLIFKSIRGGLKNQ
jgi:hypothetical protein